MFFYYRLWWRRLPGALVLLVHTMFIQDQIDRGFYIAQGVETSKRGPAAPVGIAQQPDRVAVLFGAIAQLGAMGGGLNARRPVVEPFFQHGAHQGCTLLTA